MEVERNSEMAYITITQANCKFNMANNAPRQTPFMANPFGDPTNFADL